LQYTPPVLDIISAFPHHLKKGQISITFEAKWSCTVYRSIIILLFLSSCVFSQIIVKELGRFGGTGTQPGLYKNPSALDISEDGRVFICDRGNQRIQMHDLRGKLIKEIGGFGWENEQFDEPADIWARSTIVIFVADYNNQRVERFDKDLNYVSSLFSNEGDGARFQFKEILSMAYSPQGDIFILDAGENKIIKFNAQNEGETAFGYYESGTGELMSPVQIDLTSNYKIVVSDAAAQGIFFYDYFGNYLYTINHEQFKQPHGICLDDKNRLYVADPEEKSVFIFSAQSRLIQKIDSLGGFRLKNPVDIAIHNRGNEYTLYIIDGDYIIISALRYDRPKE
jgi:hypothetical protein